MRAWGCIVWMAVLGLGGGCGTLRAYPGPGPGAEVLTNPPLTSRAPDLPPGALPGDSRWAMRQGVQEQAARLAFDPTIRLTGKVLRRSPTTVQLQDATGAKVSLRVAPSTPVVVQGRRDSLKTLRPGSEIRAAYRVTPQGLKARSFEVVR